MRPPLTGTSFLGQASTDDKSMGRQTAHMHQIYQNDVHIMPYFFFKPLQEIYVNVFFFPK